MGVTIVDVRISAADDASSKDLEDPFAGFVKTLTITNPNWR